MIEFQQIDYLGDAVLKVLAFLYNSKNPNEWNQSYGKNEFLSEVYIYMKNTIQINTLDGGKHLPTGKKAIHTRASHVESWIGECFLEGGLKYVQECWERLLQIVNDLKQRKSLVEYFIEKR